MIATTSPSTNTEQATVAPRPTIIVTHDGELRFGGTVRSHRVIVDQPLASGGADSAPTPVELLGVALGTCLALHVQQFLTTRVLPFKGLRVEVAQRRTATTSLFDVRVLMPTRPSEHHLLLLERVARSCPVYQALEPGATIDVEFRYP